MRQVPKFAEGEVETGEGVGALFFGEACIVGLLFAGFGTVATLLLLLLILAGSNPKTCINEGSRLASSLSNFTKLS